jgi:outer membrane protein assembly factor BamB
MFPSRLVYCEAFRYLDKAADTPMHKDAIFAIASMTKPIFLMLCILVRNVADGTSLFLWALNPTNNASYRIVASPLVHGELLLAPSREQPMLALRPGGKGDVTATHVVWKFESGPDVAMPVTDGQYLYVVNDSGIVYSLDAKTGAEVYGRQRLRPATYSGTPVLADGKFPALVDGCRYIRTDRHLYVIGGFPHVVGTTRP